MQKLQPVKRMKQTPKISIRRSTMVSNPDFVIAFQNPKSVRFVKASIEVMVRDDEVIDALKLHMPVIRDGIIMLFSTQTEDDLVTAEGKEKFRALILQEIRDNLEELTGNPGVEAVYFSNFVMQ